MIWNLIGAAIIVYIGSKAMKKLKAGSVCRVHHVVHPGTHLD